MFRFEHAEYLWALGIIPVLILFFVLTWYARKRAIARFGDTALMQRIIPQLSKYKHSIKFVLLMLALTTLIVGWANPQWAIRS